VIFALHEAHVVVAEAWHHRRVRTKDAAFADREVFVRIPLSALERGDEREQFRRQTGPFVIGQPLEDVAHARHAPNAVDQLRHAPAVWVANCDL
jgi:hypothetical protein